MSTTLFQAQVRATARRRMERLLVAPLAAAAVGAVWLLVEKAIGLDLQQPAFGSASPRPLGVGFAAAVAALAALLGWGLLALLERFAPHGPRLWPRAAIVVLLVTIAGPLSGHGVSVGNRAALVLMHLVTAGVVIPGLYRSAQEAKR